MPRLRLTAAHVESLPAIDGKRTEYFDVLVPELTLRVTPHGKRTWAVKFWQGRGRRGRRSMRITLGPTRRLGLAAAREEAREILERITRGEPAELAQGLTVSALVARCLEALDLRPSTRTEWMRLAKVEIEPALGRQLATELQRADVRQWLRETTRRSGWTANRAFEVLRRAYSWGRREELVRTSPCDHLEKIHIERSSDRVLDRDELRALVLALRRDWRLPYADATSLLLLTAVRRASVLGMRREELQLEDEPLWIVPADRSKSGRVHLVPLSRVAVDIVRRRLETTEASHLFPVGGRRAGLDEPMSWSGDWIRSLRRAVEDERKGPIPRWTIHGLRHTIATHLREDLGASRDVVAMLLGHTLPGSEATRIYDRAELLPERRAALERWAEWLERLAEGKAGARILPMNR